MTTFYWRWVKNFRRTRDYRLDRDRPKDKELVKRLKAEGIVNHHVEQLFQQSAAFETVRHMMQEMLTTPLVHSAKTRSDRGAGVKDFVVSVLPKQFAIDDPYVQLAVEPGLLDLVNACLGLHAYLRAIVGWVNFPTPGPPSDTQLWHQDQDDLHQVKVFLYYCSDVDGTTGPFCFIPRTHRWGTIETAKWFANALGRLTDAEMADKVPASQWFIGMGRTGTVLLADTTGCHKGLKPETAHRLLVMFHYTSGSPLHPRSFRLVGALPADVTPAQKAALGDR